jgi:hypothetical protein
MKNKKLFNNTDNYLLRIETIAGLCEHSIEPSGCMKCWEVLEWLHN